MKEKLVMTGMVLKTSPVGESDRRLVILTCERGKITAFARNARKPGNALMAKSSPFAFGKFTLYEGKDAYTLVSADISNYFREMAEDLEAACYGSYFLEFSDYYARENIDETEPLKLLYQSMRALLNPSIPDALVKPVFELKLMELNGEYMEEPPGERDGSTVYTWEYVLATPPEKLYNFTLSGPVLEEFISCVEENKGRFIDRTFHSLDILKSLMVT